VKRCLPIKRTNQLAQVVTMWYIINMKTLPVAEIRTHFSSLLKEVESGKEIGISFGRKKETVAVIVSIDEYKKIKARRLGTLEGKVKVEFKSDWSITDEEFLNS
jgi:prevent-host-death family protein